METTGTGGPGQPAIRRVRPRGQGRRKPELAQWDQESLRAADDPFQRGVLHLIEKGARHVLLLTPTTSASPSGSPASFVAACAYMTSERETLWRGLSLNTGVIADVWQKLFTQGSFEVPPTLLLTTDRENSPGFLRKAFGLSPQDWFILIRCGSPRECTGILAIVSSHSLSKEIAKAFSVRASSSQKKAA